jgi:hypothetical protein
MSHSCSGQEEADRSAGRDRRRRPCRSRAPRPARRVPTDDANHARCGRAAKHRSKARRQRRRHRAKRPGARIRGAPPCHWGPAEIIIDDFDLPETTSPRNIDKFILAAPALGICMDLRLPSRRNRCHQSCVEPAPHEICDRTRCRPYCQSQFKLSLLSSPSYRTRKTQTMNEDTTLKLQQAVDSLHSCRATLAQAVPANERFQGRPAWEGAVHVFDLEGHPKAARPYARSSPIEGSERCRFFAVLGLGAITSAVGRVRAAIVAEHRTEKEKSA